MIKTEKYNDFKFGAINAIESSEIPKESVSLSQNIIYKENRWRKLPGLVEIHTSQLAASPVYGLSKYHNIDTGKKFYMGFCGNTLFAFDLDTRVFTSIYSPLTQDSQVNFLEDHPSIYFGSDKDFWRRFDGGTISYSVGGTLNPMLKFSKIVYAPPAQRFFSIGVKEARNVAFFSAHIDDGGIEQWPDANQQIIETVRGDWPKDVQVYEGMVTFFSENSLSSINAVGVPQNWRYNREKSLTGAVSGRTVKRYGSNFFMLTPEFEVYQWPENKFITKGRVKFSIDPNYANLACAEIVENRYYYLSFKSGEAVSSDKYHLWIYDILGDRWYGPHKGYNITSMFWDDEISRLICGCDDTNQGFVTEHRGLDIRNKISSVRWVNGYNDQGLSGYDKRYSKFRIKSKQTGSNPTGSGNLEVIFNVDDNSGNPQSQTITLEDSANQNLSNTSIVKDAIVKRGFIPEQYGLGRSCQVELKHAVQGGDFQFSEFEIDYYFRTKKENRG